ncbi:SusC/RagA family TonB-linked outer membrane protein [Olivibacter jilunii]|uniref:SusC/RagA family TonB-linked outer membrane protein n=1 Tax=Olivibacter jilunii TaxID=985016 RepID=UPI003F171152
MKFISTTNLCALLLFFSAVANAQTLIEGNVVSATKSEPLIGATIKVNGKAVAETKNSDASFSFMSDSSEVWAEISYLGYETKRLSLYANQPNFVKLDPITGTLEEVTVSTGYQQIPKERATGSFEKLNNELLNRSVSTNVLDRLEGVSNGLAFDNRNYNVNQSGGNPAIRIRGVSTLFSSLDPLIILDNFPYEGNISNINPNDVASITVLKDAAASSIWGARAGNGVIVITTKKSSANQPLQVNFNSNVTIQNKPDLRRLPLMSSSDYIDVEQMLFENGYYNNSEQSLSKPAFTPVIEYLIARRDGIYTEEEAKVLIDDLRSKDVRDDFLKYVYRNQVNQQYALNVSGGSASYAYMFSAGYDRNIGNRYGLTDTRRTLRLVNSIKPLKGLEIQTSLQWTLLDNENTSASGYGQIRAAGKDLYPYAQLADGFGDPLAIAKDYRKGYTDTAGRNRLLDWNYFPLLEKGRSETKEQDLLFNVGVNYKITEDFSAELKYQMERGTNQIDYFRGLDTYYTRDLINRFTQIDNGVISYPVPMGGILENTQSRLQAHYARMQLNYKKNFGGLHELVALGGAELRETNSSSMRSTIYGYNDRLLTYARVDQVTRFPIYDNLGGLSTIPGEPFQFSDNTYRFVSAFLNASYSYKARYIISASARRDASNLFGVKSNQKGVPLWSVGMAWNIADEPFWRVKWVDGLKLRTTYGYSGNVDNSKSALTTISYAPSNPYNNLPYANVVNPSDPSLRWEQVGTFNAGLDYSLFGGRLNGSFEYYVKNTKDLFASTPIDQTTGFLNFVRNSATTRGKGFDAQMNGYGNIGAFKLAANLLLSYNRTKVLEYFSESARASSYINNGIFISPKKNEPIYMLYSYRWGGLDGDGNPQGYVGDELTTDYRRISRETTFEDLVTNGSSVPLYFGSFRPSISWRATTLSANILFRWSYYFRRQSINYSELFTNGKTHADYSLRWQHPGDEQHTNVPGLSYPANSARDDFYAKSEILVDKADHIRLRDIRLSQDFGNLRKWHIRNIQVFIYANNLGIIWKATKSTEDPEYGTALWPPKSLAFGINVSL